MAKVLDDIDASIRTAMSLYLETLAVQAATTEPAAKEPLHVQIGNWLKSIPQAQRGGPLPANMLHQRFDAEPRHLKNAMVRLGFNLKRLRYDGETIAYWVSS